MIEEILRLAAELNPTWNGTGYNLAELPEEVLVRIETLLQMALDARRSCDQLIAMAPDGKLWLAVDGVTERVNYLNRYIMQVITDIGLGLGNIEKIAADFPDIANQIETPRERVIARLRAMINNEVMPYRTRPTPAGPDLAAVSTERLELWLERLELANRARNERLHVHSPEAAALSRFWFMAWQVFLYGLAPYDEQLDRQVRQLYANDNP